MLFFYLFPSWSVRACLNDASAVSVHLAEDQSVLFQDFYQALKLNLINYIFHDYQKVRIRTHFICKRREAKTVCFRSRSTITDAVELQSYTLLQESNTPPVYLLDYFCLFSTPTAIFIRLFLFLCFVFVKPCFAGYGLLSSGNYHSASFFIRLFFDLCSVLVFFGGVAFSYLHVESVTLYTLLYQNNNRFYLNILYKKIHQIKCLTLNRVK